MSFFFFWAWVAESNNHCSHLSFTSAACWASNSPPGPSVLPLQIREDSSSSHVWRGLCTGPGIQEASSQCQLLFFTFFMKECGNCFPFLFIFSFGILINSSLKYWTLPRVLVAAAAAAKSLQSCPTLCEPIDGSPPGSPIPGILQAKALEWVAISAKKRWYCRCLHLKESGKCRESWHKSCISMRCPSMKGRDTQARS